jgi:hypothetical protein
MSPPKNPKIEEEDLQRDDGGAGHSLNKSKKDVDRELDKALQQSFPSSDPRPLRSRARTNPPAIRR